MKFATTLMLDQELHNKLCMISSIRKWFFGEKEMSLSGIVNIALKEYFDNHKEEIERLIDDYHSKGGCGDI